VIKLQSVLGNLAWVERTRTLLIAKIATGSPAVWSECHASDFVSRIRERWRTSREVAHDTPGRLAGVDVGVRPATVDDAEAMGRVHVVAWQAAYVGLMPQDYLDRLDAGQRAQMWRRRLSQPRDRAANLVATVHGEVVGFASFGPEGFDQQAAAGELYAINVRPDRWGVGAGRALLAAVHAGLAELGYRRAVLWVATGNQRARAVYERYGWCSEGVERAADVLGDTVPEVRYRRALDGQSG
jgi:RimJ/RimL family protein N-acetyltransferase